MSLTESETDEIILILSLTMVGHHPAEHSPLRRSSSPIFIIVLTHQTRNNNKHTPLVALHPLHVAPNAFLIHLFALLPPTDRSGRHVTNPEIFDDPYRRGANAYRDDMFTYPSDRAPLGRAGPNHPWVTIFFP